MTVRQENVGNLNVINTSSLVSIQNSAGWIFAQSNTGGLVTIANSSNISIANSAGWVFAQSNTAGITATIINSSNLNIANSSGWIVAQSNTVNAVNVINSAGWVVAISNTAGGTFTLLNSSALAGINDFSQMTSSAVARTPGFAVISVSATDNTVVSALATRAILVVAYQMMANASVNARWLNGIGGTALTGYAFLTGNVGMVAPFNPMGWFRTGTNTLLDLNLTSAQSIGGCITYFEV